jgi:hypothetical protein
MNLFTWINDGIAGLDWIDMSLIKFSSIAFGLLLASLLPALADVHFLWYLLIMLLFAVKPVYKVIVR